MSKSRYYAVSTDRLVEILGEAGFVEAKPLDGRYFQPVLVARRRPGEEFLGR